MNKYKIALLVCAIAWGFGYVAMDHLVATTSTFMAIGLRFTFASLAILAIYFKKIRQSIKQNYKQAIILGVVLFIAFLFQTLGLVISTTAKNAFLTTTNVLWVPILLAVFYKKHIPAKIYISASIMVLGVALVSLDGISSFNIGDVSTLLGALFFALHIVLIGRYINQTNLDSIVFGQLFVAGILGLITAVLLDQATIVIGFEFMSAFLFAVFISTALCFFLQNYGISNVDSSVAAIILSLEAMFGVVAAILIDGEAVNAITLIGFLIMFVSILVAEMRT